MLMELAEGSLANILYATPTAPRSLTWAACITYAREICDGLAYLHTRTPRILHLDLKPQNVLWFGNKTKKTLKLCDFGLSRQGPTGDATKFDLSRLPGGTLRYACPFQMTMPSVMPANDVYSFGVILFWFVCREEPWKGATFGQIAHGRLIDHFAPVADCPPAFAALCARCIDPDPQKRPKDGVELQSALNDMTLGGVALTASSASDNVPGGSFASSSQQDRTPTDSRVEEESQMFEANYSNSYQ